MHTSTLSPESPNAQNDLHLYRKGFKVAKQGKRGGVHRSHFIELMEKVNAAYRASGSMAAHHYIHEKHITDATFLPVWVFMEFATFGNLSVLLSAGLKMETVAAIAAELGFPPVNSFCRPFLSCTACATNAPTRDACGTGIGCKSARTVPWPPS